MIRRTTKDENSCKDLIKTQYKVFASIKLSDDLLFRLGIPSHLEGSLRDLMMGNVSVIISFTGIQL